MPNFSAFTLAKIAARDKAAAALAESRRRASETQAAREAAETAFAVSAADAFTAGRPTPSIPKELAALRAADDLADSVVAVLEPRAQEAKQEADAAASAEIAEMIDAQCASDAAAAHAALKAMASAWCKLQLAAPRVAAVLGSTLTAHERTDIIARAGSAADLVALCDLAGIPPGMVRGDSNVQGDARARHPLPCVDDVIAAVRNANV